MNNFDIQELALSRISDLVDQLAHHQANGDEVNMTIVNEEIKDLTAALDSEDAADNIFWVRDHKYIY